MDDGRAMRSILSPDTCTNSCARVEDSVAFDRLEVGRRARIRRIITNKGVKVPAGVSIGCKLEEDGKRFTLSESGVVVILKGTRIEEGS